MKTSGDGLDITGRVVGRYTRISDDRLLGIEEEEGKGIARQLADETAFIRSAGGIAGPEYPENDTSAYKTKRIVLPDGRMVWPVVRPWWEKACTRRRRHADGRGRRGASRPHAGRFRSDVHGPALRLRS